jgi:hypothetical protein
MADNEEFDTDKIEVVEPDVEPTVQPLTEEKPRGKTSLPTIALIVLNLFAALGFGALLYVDMGRRQAWAKAVLARDLAIVGLPVDDKDIRLSTNPDGTTASAQDLDPPLIKDAYKARGGKLNDRFMQVREIFGVDIRPADLDQEILAKFFADGQGGSPVSTLQEEVKRVKDKLPAEIDTVAQSAANKVKDKSSEEKQALLRRVLFPLCSEGWQLDELEKKIQEKRTPKQDEDFLVSALKRRMWFDVLKPLEVFRPSAKSGEGEKAAGEAKDKKSVVDRAGNPDEISVDELKKHFVKRCDDALAGKDWIDGTIKRDNAEKRRYVAFLLAAVSRIEIPGADPTEQKAPVEQGAKKAAKVAKKEAGGEGEEEPKAAEQPAAKAEKQRPTLQLAFPAAERRAEVVCGLQAFDQACEDLALVTEIVTNQTIAAIYRDLGHFRYPADSTVYSNANGFLAKYDMAVRRVQELAMLVARHERQYAELSGIHDQNAKLLESRVAQEKDTVEKLFEARAFTRQLARDLKNLQDQLFVAQTNLRGAHEYIQYLADRLQAAERNGAKSKGGPGQ